MKIIVFTRDGTIGTEIIISEAYFVSKFELGLLYIAIYDGIFILVDGHKLLNIRK